MNELTTTRRSALRRAIALAAGAVGAGSLASAASAGGPHTLTMRLAAHFVETRGAEGQRHATLVDAAGVTVGHLAGTRSDLASPYGVEGAVTSLELHSLSLEGGTLLAQGAVHGRTGTFHVVGGDGRFEGARGAYVFTLGHAGAELTLTIETREGW